MIDPFVLRLNKDLTTIYQYIEAIELVYEESHVNRKKFNHKMQSGETNIFRCNPFPKGNGYYPLPRQQSGRQGYKVRNRVVILNIDPSLFSELPRILFQLDNLSMTSIQSALVAP